MAGAARSLPSSFVFSDYLYVPVRLASSADVLPRCLLGSGSPHPAPRCRVIAPRCPLAALAMPNIFFTVSVSTYLGWLQSTLGPSLFFKHTGAAPPRVKRAGSH